MIRSRVLKIVRPPPTTPGGMCALTGKCPVDDWTAHTASSDFRIARMLAERLTNSTQPIQARNLWSELANPTKLVDELCSSRRGNLSTTLQFLRHHNVLLHSLLRFNGATSAWHVTNDFSRTSYVGECLLRNEATARIVKVFPEVEYDLLRTVVQRAGSPEALAAFYDSVCLNRLLDRVGRRKTKVTMEQKSQLVLASLGEMHWFSVRTKATDRTHNNALFPPSDVLILHVLCCHCVELMIAELVLAVLEPALKQLVQSAWTNFHVSTPEQYKLKPRTLGAMSLNLEPLPRPAPLAPPNPVPLQLQKQPMFSSVTSLAKVKVNYKRFDKLPTPAPTTLCLSKVPSTTRGVE